MVNLTISVHQGNEDGSSSCVAIDVLKREDATALESKIIKHLEDYVWEMIKTIPNFKIKESRVLQEMPFNEETVE